MKKEIKIILTIVIIVLVAIIGGGIGYLVSIKKDYNTKITELENKILLLESNTKDNKTSNSTEKTTNEKDMNNNTDLKEPSNSSVLDAKQAETEVKKMYEIMEKNIYGGEWIANNIEEETNGYLVTSCKYLDDYSNKYMTLDVLNEYLDNMKIEKKGDKYYCPADFIFSKDNTYISKEINIANIEENKITAKVTATYAVVDAGNYDEDGKKDSKHNKVYDFAIEKKDGEWKVSKFICPF